MSKLKVLLVTPKFNIYGGVSEFNKMILRYSKMDITPFFITSAGNSYSTFITLLFTCYDFFRLIFILFFRNIKIVHINPSLGYTSILRDSVFIWIAKVFGKKVFVHWHGWNPDNEYLLTKYNHFLKLTLFKADHIKLLASVFQKKIIGSGYKNKSSLGNTFIDDKLLEYEIKKNNIGKSVNILFLSTISKNKGIYEALETYQLLKQKYPFIKFIIAGIGEELESVRNFVSKNQIPDIEFKGYVSGIEKSKTLSEADIYFFPSHYEGMPTSVIEAMGFGTPVVCSEVGAIPDFFINLEMGFIIKCPNTRKYYDSIAELIADKELRRKIGIYNYKYIRENFLASKSIDKIDKIYKELSN